MEKSEMLYEELLDQLAHEFFDEYNWDYESMPVRNWASLIDMAEDLGKYHIIRDIHNKAIEILMNI